MTAVDSLSSPAMMVMIRIMTVIIQIMSLMKTGHRVPPRTLSESTQMMSLSIRMMTVMTASMTFMIRMMSLSTADWDGHDRGP